MPENDSELVNRIREQRDHAAFNELYAAYYRHVQKHIIKRFSCSADAAEDAAQYAFAMLWRGMKLTGTSAMPILCTYAANYLMSQYRQRNAHPWVSLTPVGDEPPIDLPDVRQTAEPDLPPMIPELLAALKMLPAREADALNLFYMLGERQGAIAEKMGVSNSSVSRCISSALDSLRTMLGVPKPKGVRYLIHQHDTRFKRRYQFDPSVRERHTQATKAYRDRIRARAYAACESADNALRLQKKGSASVKPSTEFGKAV